MELGLPGDLFWRRMGDLPQGSLREVLGWALGEKGLWGVHGGGEASKHGTLPMYAQRGATHLTQCTSSLYSTNAAFEM